MCNMEITEEQKQLLQNTKLQNGMTAWEYVQLQSEDDQPWAIAGILSCMKKGYRLHDGQICWEARNLRYAQSSNETLEITEEQKQLLQSKVMGNGMTAWEYIQSQNEEDRPWVIAGAKSCIEKGYGLTMLEINSEARRIRSGR